MPATEKLRQSQIMLGAAESGNRAAQTALDSRLNRRQRDLDRGERAREFDESIEQQELNRWERQWQQRRAERTQREQGLAERQAAKPRTTNFGTEGTAPGGGGEPAPDIQQQQLQERQRQFDVSTQLQAADRGLQQTGGMPGGNPGPDNPRLTAMQAEMDQRGQAQMGQRLEAGTQGKGFVKTEERKAQEQSKTDVAMERAKTDRINAIIRHREQVKRYQAQEIKLGAAKTAAAKKEAQAGLDKIDHDLMQKLVATGEQLSRLRKGDINPDLWQSLQREVENDPPAGTLAQTMAEIEAREFGPNLSRFLGEKQSTQILKYTEGTGNVPSGKIVDFSTEGMQLFVKNVPFAKMLLTTGVNAILYRDMPQEEFLSLTNKQAAKLARQGLSLEQVIKQAGGVTGEDVRNTSRKEEPPPAYEQRPGPGGQVPPGGPGEPGKGQITPAGAAAKGGTDFTDQPYPTKGPKQKREGPVGPYQGFSAADMAGVQ